MPFVYTILLLQEKRGASPPVPAAPIDEVRHKNRHIMMPRQALCLVLNEDAVNRRLFAGIPGKQNQNAFAADRLRHWSTILLGCLLLRSRLLLEDANARAIGV